MLRGGDVKEIRELRRQGLSVTELSALTGWSRDTIRKYLDGSDPPQYGPRAKRASKLDPFEGYLKERLQAGVWNAVTLHRELKQRGYLGGYTGIKEYLQPLRQQAREGAVRRFETPPGRQAQVDWGEIGFLEEEGGRKKLSCFVMTLGHSRAMFSDVATDQQLGTLLLLHERAFEGLGGVPEEILYDHMKTVVLGMDDRGEIRWQPTFRDFAGYWGFTPRLCRPYRPQTKGKTESGVGYVKKSFVPGVTATSLSDLRTQHREWLWGVANRRVHGTTHRVVFEAWEEERAALLPLGDRASYPYEPEVTRRAARDAYVSYATSRYSVPWRLAGEEVRLREIDGQLVIYREGARVATHARSLQKYQVITDPSHHVGMPTVDGKRSKKAQVRIEAASPEVEARSLSVYDTLAGGEIEGVLPQEIELFTPSIDLSAGNPSEGEGRW